MSLSSAWRSSIAMDLMKKRRLSSHHVDEETSIIVGSIRSYIAIGLKEASACLQLLVR